MQKLVKVQDKYYLKTLHAEIDLYDRKLAHLTNYEVFATEAEREVAVGKISAKRKLLERAARKLAADGIEFSSADLPRSFRAQPETAGRV